MKDLQEALPVSTTNILGLHENPARLMQFDPNVRNPAEQLTVRTQALLAEVKSKFPKLSPDQRQFAIDVVYGPLGLKVDQFSQEKKDDIAERNGINREKTHSARVQHTFVDAIIHASNPNSDPILAKKIYLQLAKFQQLSATPFGQKMEITSFLNGIRAERGVIDALRAGGYDVYLPDYQPQGWNQDYSESEVYKWDVQNGIDLVARKGDNVFLVDAKGRKKVMDTTTGREVIRNNVEVISGQPYEVSRAALRRVDGLEEIFAMCDDPSIYRLKIIVPTEPTDLGPLYKVNDDSQIKQALKLFGRLKKEHIIDMVTDLSKITTQTQKAKGGQNGRQVA